MSWIKPIWVQIKAKLLGFLGTFNWEWPMYISKRYQTMPAKCPWIDPDDTHTDWMRKFTFINSPIESEKNTSDCSVCSILLLFINKWKLWKPVRPTCTPRIHNNMDVIWCSSLIICTCIQIYNVGLNPGRLKPFIKHWPLIGHLHLHEKKSCKVAMQLCQNSLTS